ncbi:MAG: hypothetical protein ACHP7F_09925 [Actinomycetales bacterium]
MLRTVRNANLPLPTLLKVLAATLMTASVLGPTITHAQTENTTRTPSHATATHDQQQSVDRTAARSRLESEADTTLAGATATVTADQSKADASAAVVAIAGLDDVVKLDDSALRKQIDTTRAASDALAAAAAQADRNAAAAAAAAAATALANANTPDGAKATARSLVTARGWGDAEFQCLSNLWQKESQWNYKSYNGGSGATGIPQALPGSKMASAGTDWQTNAATQIKWGLDYIARGYGTPCSAWSHSQAVNWY